jgi:hypothetical protein
LGEDERFLSQLETLTSIDRCAIIVRARQPFLEWLQSVDPSADRFSLSDLNSEQRIYLTPDADVEAHYLAIFEKELVTWWNAASDWPADLTWELFEQRFDYEVASVVTDCGQRPIKREPLL